MGISSLPTPSEAFFPFLLLANALTPVLVLVDGMRWAFVHVMGCSSYQSQGGVLVLAGEQPAAAAAAADAQQQQQEQEEQQEEEEEGEVMKKKKRGLVGVHVTRFNLLAVRERDECCVCLHGFEGEEEVSEVVACRHLFHRGCLERWVSHLHSTCPLCRSML